MTIDHAVSTLVDYALDTPKDFDTDYHAAESIRFLESVQAPDSDRRHSFDTFVHLGRLKAEERGNPWM